MVASHEPPQVGIAAEVLPLDDKEELLWQDAVVVLLGGLHAHVHLIITAARGDVYGTIGVGDGRDVAVAAIFLEVLRHEGVGRALTNEGGTSRGEIDMIGAG